MTDLSWIDCGACGQRYASFMSACPGCGAENLLPATTTAAAAFTPSPAATTTAVAPAPPPAGRNGKNAAGRLAVAAGVAAITILAAVLLVPALGSIATEILVTGEDQERFPVLKILQPQAQKPRAVPHEELVARALELINADRAGFGLQPVALSENQAAQAHAEDVFENKQISHWMSNGEKPYMTYTRYGGQGSVHQNVAIAGFGPAQYDRCVARQDDCETIEPAETVEQLQYEMMYLDEECCGNGHRNNILDPHHTHVSIGLVYDEYYLAFVQNFENRYGLEFSVDGGMVRLAGALEASSSPADAGRLEQIDVFYDRLPAPGDYESNKLMLSYSSGELVASVAEPLAPGFYYKQPEDGRYAVVEADRWVMGGESSGSGGGSGTIDVEFHLAGVTEARGDGVYTLYAIFSSGEGGGDGEGAPAGQGEKQDSGDGRFQATSYSIFVQSGGTSEGTPES